MMTDSFVVVLDPSLWDRRCRSTIGTPATPEGRRSAYLGTDGARVSGVLDFGAQCLELSAEVLISPVDQPDAPHLGDSLGGQGRNQMGEATPQVRHLDVGGPQRGRKIGRASCREGRRMAAG